MHAWIDLRKIFYLCFIHTHKKKNKTDNQQWLKKLTLLHFFTSVQKRNNEFTFNGKA